MACSGYPSAPPPPYPQDINELDQQASPGQSSQQLPDKQPDSSEPYLPTQPYPNQPYSQPYSSQPYSELSSQHHDLSSELFGLQPHHYGNADDDNDSSTTGAFTEKSIRAGICLQYVTMLMK